MAKSSVMPLVPTDPERWPRLFLDGGLVSKVDKSDSCLAWMVKPLPTEKTKDEKKDEGQTGFEMSDYKRRRLELQEEERKAKAPVATHKVMYKHTISVALKINGEDAVASYGRPTLVDNAAFDVMDKKLYREVFWWDAEELVKIKKSKVDTLFVMS
jgi:hypothetical protein